MQMIDEERFTKDKRINVNLQYFDQKDKFEPRVS